MYVTRQNQKEIYKSFGSSKVSALLGPRRVGKSTFVQHYVEQHPEKKWVQLNMDIRAERQRIEKDELELLIEEKSFQKIASTKPLSVVIDEAQKCTGLTEQIKVLYDRYKDQNAIKFILTGSGALSLHRMASESLAGRIELNPLREFGLRETAAAALLQSELPQGSLLEDLLEGRDLSEIENKQNDLMPWREQLEKAIATQMVWGGLPEVVLETDNSERLKYLLNYLQTYLEKDVRDVATISDLNLYQNMMEIVAQQTGSLREDKKLVEALGCSRDTLKKYRGFLQATLVYRDVFPYVGSSLRRLVKSPKGYLNNNGLISLLTGVHDMQILKSTGTLGHRFENWVLKEIQIVLDRFQNKNDIYFWRTSGGVEVDFVVKNPPHVIPLEATCASQPEGKKIRNLQSFLHEHKKIPYGLYIYNGPFKIDREGKIAFFPAWMMG